MEAADSLPGLLADNRIKLKRTTPGHTEQVRCPRCEGGRTKEVSLTVTIDADGMGAVWTCHRGSCGWADGARVRGAASRPPVQERVIQKPTPTPPEDQSRPDWLYEFFAERKIGARTVNHFGVYADTHWFGKLGTQPCIVFPYLSGGELVNRKYRPHPQKQPQAQDKDAAQTLFNVDALGDSPNEIVFVEGEPDVMALFECGITNAVSIKDGAPSPRPDGSAPAEDKRYEALRTHADLLGKAKRIILAGDMDAPGLLLRDQLANRFGRHLCRTVTWPDGCKDAGEVLREHGPDAVTAAIRKAQPYPVEGLQNVLPGTLLRLREAPPPETLTTGCQATDNAFRLPTEGRLIVVTGRPNHGKTVYTRYVLLHIARYHGRKLAIFSPEMQPWEHFALECAEVLMGKTFWPKGDGAEAMTNDEIARAEAWLLPRMTMIASNAEGDPPTLDYLLGKARMAVLRDGVQDLLIDPWNEVTPDRGVLTETEWIGRCLQRLKAFGLMHECNVWVIAHPKNPPQFRPHEKPPAPGPYDINGGANWANKADLGLTVHCPDGPEGVTEIHVWKARFRRFGQRGRMARIHFDPLTGRYSDPVGAIPDDGYPDTPPQ